MMACGAIGTKDVRLLRNLDQRLKELTQVCNLLEVIMSDSAFKCHDWNFVQVHDVIIGNRGRRGTCTPTES